MKFGRDQIKHPTPASINFWVRVGTVSAGVLLTAMESFPYHTVSGLVESTIKWFLGLGIALGNGLAPLFGAEVESKTVPIEDVTAMEEKK